MLNFQIEPIPDIIFVGDEPEMPEIIAVLANMHAPVWMIGLIDVVIKTKLRERTAQKSPPPSNAH